MRAIAEGTSGLPVVFPVHPRTAKTLRDLSEAPSSFRLVDPQPYLECNYLVRHAKPVITASAGITEETTVMGVPCMALRDSTERSDTVTIGTNELIATNPAGLATVPAGFLRPIGYWEMASLGPCVDNRFLNSCGVRLSRLE